VLLLDIGPYGRLGRIDGSAVKHGRYVADYSPRVTTSGSRVVQEIERQDLTVPESPLLDQFVNYPSTVERGQTSVLLFDGAFEIGDGSF
jgi:hypothetical protein